MIPGLNRVDETGKQQRMMMHWTDYIRYLPSAVWTLIRYGRK